MSGPLTGLRVLEFAGIGPGPFCGMLLADMGADVLRLDRARPVELGTGVDPRFDVLGRGKRSLGLDLKRAEHRDLALELAARADALVEGHRPGAMERLGLGPDRCLARNPRLVYGRVTGWGQDGPLAQAAGHDVNYIALAGALHAIGTAEAPLVPPPLIGDFGGGAMSLAFGMACALLDVQRGGRGQVVDASITDAVALLMAPFYARHAAGAWADARASNALDGGAPWYDVYRTADGAWVSIGPIEGRFWDELLRRMGLDAADLPPQRDRAGWPRLRERLAAAFAGRTRDEWRGLLEGTDACFAPVLSLAEAPLHPQHVARGSFDRTHGWPQPAPAPRLSATPGALRRRPPRTGEGGREALADWGLAAADIDAHEARGVRCAPAPATEDPQR